MSRLIRFVAKAASAATVLTLSIGIVFTQAQVVDPASKPLPNPNPTVVKNWGSLPDNRVWGSTAGVDIGPDGNVWAYDRCGANTCAQSNVDPIFKFDRSSGKMLRSFGGGMIVFPHGIHVDRQGNVWITDGNDNAPAAARGAAAGARGVPGPNPQATKGHQIFKFSPEGKLLLTIGKPGGGSGDECCFQPNDVITNDKGEVFISEGHTTGGRIRKFSSDGRLIKTWGESGSGAGQFNVPHALAFDSRGRLFVADRQNHRIQIFDQEGKFIEEWKQFSRISGLFIDRNDNLYAIDSESSTTRHADWKTGIRIGKTTEDKVLSFIPPHQTEQPYGAAGEGVAVDPDGNVYAAEGPLSRQAAGGGITKYLKR
jgi:DNA-binding beta-propeller fold protein YncE